MLLKKPPVAGIILLPVLYLLSAIWVLRRIKNSQQIHCPGIDNRGGFHYNLQV